MKAKLTPRKKKCKREFVRVKVTPSNSGTGDPNGMIFGMLSETGRLCLNAFTGILDQPTLQL